MRLHARPRRPSAARFSPLVLLPVLLLLAGSAGGAEPSRPAPRIDRGLQALERGAPVPVANRPVARDHRLDAQLRGRPESPRPEYVEPQEFGLLLEFDGTRAALEAAGVRVNSQVGQVFTGRIRRSEIGRLRALPGLRSARLSHYAEPHLNLSAIDVRADLEHGAVGTPPFYSGRAGRGLILGDVDTGIDFNSADFRDSLGQTRILYIWDQSDAVGPNPAGYTYGSEWTKAQIDATPGAIRQADSNGHGTLVGGVLAGSGATTGCTQAAYRYVGMAPQANLIEVKTDFSDAGIIDGVNYVFQKAAALGVDAIVNLSLGSQFGPHDGSDLFSSSISALTGPGRIVVASAGNDQADNIHGKITTTSTTVGVDRMAVSVPAYSANPGTFNDYFVATGWYDLTGDFTIKVKSPNGSDTLSCGMFASRDKSTSSGKIFIANQDPLYGFDGTPRGRQFEVEVYDSLVSRQPRQGSWEIDIVPNSAASIGKRVDLWVYASQLGSKVATVTTGLDATTLVGGPADGDSVFAVAAHSTKASWASCLAGGTCGYITPPTVNDIASFSSHGPRRDGVLKPEISAPGFGVASTHSYQAPALSACYDADDGTHEVTQGTSFSAPHVAGAAALLLQAYPHLSPSGVKLAFESHARADGYTGAVPNSTWGYGKLDIYGTFDHAAPAVALTAPAGGETWTGGSTHAVTWTASDNVAVAAIDLAYSTDGGATYPDPIATGIANTGSYSWTLPAISTTQARVRVTARDAMGNSAAAASAGNFTIGGGDAPPAVSISAPNGGESWIGGTTQSIVWSASDDVAVTAIDLAYSIDGGASFPGAIATGIANSGSYAWTVPMITSSQARVRVTAHDGAGHATSASSAADFALAADAAPSVTITAPVGGESWGTGTVRSITWTASDDVGVTAVDLAYSTDGGATYPHAIASGLANSGAYSWTVPGTPTPTARVRVTAHDGAGHATAAASPASFAIVDVVAPTVAVTAPVGGEQWLEGTSQTILWTAADNVAVDSVNVDYSLHGAGGPWLAVAHGLANSGSFGWTVPAGATDSALVRVTAFDAALNQTADESDSLFHITTLVAVWQGADMSFALAAPAPNPTRGAVTVRFRLPSAAPVGVEVVGVNGQIVWRRAMGTLPAGEHAVLWSGAGDAGPGLYFVRVTSPFGTRTHKVLRLR